MLRCTYSEFVARTDRADIATALERLEEAKKTAGSRAACDLLIHEVGLASWKILNESYYEESLHYYLGHLQAYLGHPELAARHIEMSHTTPSAGGDITYEVHSRDAQVLAEWKGRAQARGLPSILLASMPRAASASLTQNLSRMLDVPVMRLSAGSFPDYALFPTWLRFFLSGGAITHDHFGATPHNLRVLEDSGLHHVFVLARDPRSAASSYARFVQRGQVDNYNEDKPYEEMLLDTCLNKYIPWMQQWLNYDRSPDRKLTIGWLRYRDVVQATPEVLASIRHAFPDQAAVMAQCSTPAGSPLPDRANFVEGDDDAWRKQVSEATKERLWQACSSEMIELLELKA